MNKTRLIIIGGIVLISFVASLLLGWLMTPAPIAPQVVQQAPPPEPLAVSAGLAGSEAKLTPREKQLEELIRELQATISEYQLKHRKLESEQLRLQMAQQHLEKQVRDLENLRIEILAPLAALKDEQIKLDQTRLRIKQEERANLRRAAAIYEKMDAQAGSRILAEMATGSQIDDAVRILYYMSEKSAARIFAEIPDDELASRLTLRLKQIREEG